MRRAFVLVAIVGCGGSSTQPPPSDAAAETEPRPYTPPVELGRHVVDVVDTRVIVPGPGLPKEAPPQTSNNNLDAVRHDGRVWLAWRTAPSHYASDKVALYVLSSDDEKTWRFETKLTSGFDLREPRFLSFNGSLFLYVARLGTNPNRFEPKGMSYVERSPAGTWGALTDFHKETFIPWRAKIERGTPYLVAYSHGELIYAPKSGQELEIELLTTTDGKTWRGVDPANPVVSKGGGSETDFVLADDGALLAVTRNELGDASGFGSKICTAPPAKITEWKCKNDPRKFDSPLLFWHDGEAYLVARRHLSPTGEYDLAENRDRPFYERWFKNQVDYKVWPKRCSLWRWVRGEDRIAFVLDLPSKGDTCFPAMIPGDEPGEIVVYDYSSPLEGPDLAWNEGQIGPTRISRHLLRFTRR